MAQIFRTRLVNQKMIQNGSNCHTYLKRLSSNVGFIGLGNMGSHMASNLMKKGHKLSVFDISTPAVTALTDKGAKACSSPAEVAKSSDIVVTMLPNNNIVLNCYKELVKTAKKGSLFLDSSTIDPKIAQKVQKIVQEHDSRFLDAPVSGGVIGAKNATLTFMVGGFEPDVEAAKPLLSCMGAKITHCGKHGMGQAAKLCNNMLLGISMIGVSEAMNLGIRLGLDAKTFMDIVNASTGRCWSSEVNNPVPNLVPTAPPSNEYKGGFATKLIAKDLGLAIGVATDSLTPVPLGAMAHQLYNTLLTHGLGDKDFSVIYDFLKEADKKKQ